MKLVQTSSEFPEQYDVFHQKRRVGYLRLRYGNFTVQYPDVYGRVVYSAVTRGVGRFEDSEREEHLDAAKLAIRVAWEADQEVPGPARPRAGARERVPRTSTEVAASLERESVRVNAQLTDLSAAFAQIQSAGAHWSGMSETLLREMIAMRPLPVHGDGNWTPLTFPTATGRIVEPGVEYVREFIDETHYRPRPRPAD